MFNKKIDQFSFFYKYLMYLTTIIKQIVSPIQIKMYLFLINTKLQHFKLSFKCYKNAFLRYKKKYSYLFLYLFIFYIRYI